MQKKNKEKNTRKEMKIIIDGKTYTYYVHRRRPYINGFAREKPATVTGKDGKTKNTRRRKTQGAKMRDRIKRNERKMKAKQLSLFD